MYDTIWVDANLATMRAGGAPYGVIKRANVAEVFLLATQPGAVKLYPALTV